MKLQYNFGHQSSAEVPRWWTHLFGKMRCFHSMGRRYRSCVFRFPDLTLCISLFGWSDLLPYNKTIIIKQNKTIILRIVLPSVLWVILMNYRTWKGLWKPYRFVAGVGQKYRWPGTTLGTVLVGIGSLILWGPPMIWVLLVRTELQYTRWCQTVGVEMEEVCNLIHTLPNRGRSIKPAVWRPRWLWKQNIFGK